MRSNNLQFWGLIVRCNAVVVELHDGMTRLNSSLSSIMIIEFFSETPDLYFVHVITVSMLCCQKNLV